MKIEEKKLVLRFFLATQTAINIRFQIISAHMYGTKKE